MKIVTEEGWQNFKLVKIIIYIFVSAASRFMKNFKHACKILEAGCSYHLDMHGQRRRLHHHWEEALVTAGN